MSNIEVTFEVTTAFRCDAEDLCLDQNGHMLTDRPEELAGLISELMSDQNHFDATDYWVVPASITVKTKT